MKKTRFYLIITLFILIPNICKSQYYESRLVDINLNYNDFRLKFRPLFYTIGGNYIRSDISFGKKHIFKKVPLGIYAYSMREFNYKDGDSHVDRWRLGFHSEFIQYFWKSRIRLKVQARYLFGINDAPDRYYLIPALSYRFNRFGIPGAETGKKPWSASLGIWSLFREDIDVDNTNRNYLGPSFSLSYNNVGLFVAYNTDLTTINDDEIRYWMFGLVYVNLNFKQRK